MSAARLYLMALMLACVSGFRIPLDRRWGEPSKRRCSPRHVGMPRGACKHSGATSLSCGQPQEKEEMQSQSLERRARLMLGRGSSTIIFAALLLLVPLSLGVAAFLGLDIQLPGLGRDVNRGAGTPLDMREVSQLMRDEQLKRTTLDAWRTDGRGQPVEEVREEEALLRVITGGEMRVK